MTTSAFLPFFDLLLSVALAMARIYPVAYLVPVFCFQHLRGLPRHAVVFALAMLPAPGIRQALLDAQVHWLSLAGLMLKELVLGLLLGVLLAMPFWLFESVGALLDNQRGALIGGQLNPALGTDTTPLGHLFKESLILLLVATLGLGSLTQVIWDSYLVWSPTTWLPLPGAQGFAVFLDLLGDMFMHMLLYAAPFIGLLLLVEFSLALLSLYSPQLQVFILAMPAKSLIGLGFLLFYLPTLWEAMTGRLMGYADIRHLLDLLLQAP
ncbi:type III secretion system export apparatus subunit SctT [Pseudomonas sp. S75]|uniref:type III secretion system export apparatus subunit SctT n=1 Tax=unclassified Pseudomonas TaxID=196821 RepID=UPI001908B60A|nr:MULTISPECIES: type III secretion system export apparatus subunit SctT [unclassified Pseudomonas]MBJ9977910.1 type III secretion system export apparatus subunit SctT [Pseudomonas sp. S30]MBK0155884.1 type III secretion system export apparatus subunit SctT [Pseudomonas sp. S75]